MPRLIVPAGVSAVLFLLIAATAPAATLKVGPSQRFARPSQAIQAARRGDTIEIDAGSYPGDVATVRANNLTIRGVGNGRAKLPANGKDAGGKAIWVVTGSDLTVENIEFSGARVRDRNGAGMRAEGKNLTVRNCRFYDCENGILGGNGEMLFEHCEFEHCGPVPNPATHSLYIGQRCTKLVFRYNYSTDVIEGHLLKSRAKESWLLYNRITDENGSGSAVADFPNGGVVVVVGNLMHKGARGNNSRVIAYGMEGVKHERNALCVVNNTMVYDHRHTNSFFVRVEKSPETLVPIIRNNLCIGKVPLTNWAKADTAGNLLFKTVAEAGLVDPANYDYRLKAGSPCIAKGVAASKLRDFDLTPTEQYVHPCQREPRAAAGPLDVGACQFGAAGKPTGTTGRKYGTFGHGISNRTPDGQLHGSIPPYGPVNAAGLVANLAIVMGKKCGVRDPEIDPAIERASRFFGYFVDKGAIPYGEHMPWPNHENNGKTDMAAMLFAVQGNRIRETQYFAKMVTASYQNREYGHTGQGFSYLWGALGANTGGPAAAAAFIKEASWHLDLVRRCDGSFTYDGGEQYGPGKTDDNTYYGKSSYYASACCPTKIAGCGSRQRAP